MFCVVVGNVYETNEPASPNILADVTGQLTHLALSPPGPERMVLILIFSATTELSSPEIRSF